MISVRLFLLGSTLLFLAGCASGPGPDLSGAEGPTLMAAYSGEWTLLRLESDDLNEKMRENMAGGGGMSGGGRGGGMTDGRRGGMSGGGRGGMAGGVGVGMDPQEMRAAMEAIRTLAETPGEMVLSLTPDAVSVQAAQFAPMELALGAEEEQFRQGTLTVFVRAKWTKKGLEIEREVDEGVGVKDQISVDDQGRLVMKREIDLMGGSVDGILVYRRKTG